MEDVISKLAEIETAASRIMENIADQKKQLAEQQDVDIKAFDEEVDRQTAQQLEVLCRELEITMQKELDRQKHTTDECLAHMETYYQEHHDEMVQNLYHKILRM